MIAGWVVVGVATIVLIAAIRAHGRVMRTPPSAAAPWPKIIPIELAGSGERMALLLDRLGSIGRERLQVALRIDSLIIAGYVALLTTLCLMSTATVRAASGGTLETIGLVVATVMAVATVAAGCLDLVENRALQAVIKSYRDRPLPAEPNEDEAAARATQRREDVVNIDGPSRVAARAATWKFRLLALVGIWLLTALWIMVTHCLA